MADIAEASWGPVLVIAIYVVAGLVAFPVMLLIAVTAATFGAWPGMLYAAAGSMASALVTYLIGRRLGAELLRNLLGPRINRISRGIARRGVLAVAAIRLVPVAPFTLVNLVAGASRVRPLDYLRRHGARHGAGHRADVDARQPGVRRAERPELDRRAAVRRRHRRLGRHLARLPAAGHPVEEIGLTAPTIRVLTWNIHGGIGPDGICDLSRIVALVSRHAPDIVALQEVDSRRLSAGETPFAYLKQSLGKHSVEAKAITAPDGEYGHVVISRWPMENTRLHDISVSGREPRRAIETTIRTRARAAAFRGGASRPRPSASARRQADTLAALAEAGPGPTVMAGDFNDWLWRGRVNSALRRRLPDRTWQRTFPARFPLARARPHLLPPRRDAGPELDRSARPATPRTICRSSPRSPSFRGEGMVPRRRSALSRNDKRQRAARGSKPGRLWAGG